MYTKLLSSRTFNSVLYIVVFSLLYCYCVDAQAFTAVDEDSSASSFAADISALDADYSAQSTSYNTYDYIVVGVGHAGSITASRLAVAGNTVLGIEAGGPTHKVLGGTDYVASDFSLDSQGNVIVNEPWTRFDVPNFFSSIYAPPYPPYPDWRFIRNGVNADSQVAKLLGGSGAHNGMLWLRFTKETINSWNVTGWSYNDLLPVYKRLENVTGSIVANNSAYHGYTGPIQMSDTPNSIYYSAHIPKWLESCRASGLPANADFNGANRAGCGIMQFNIRRGVRDSTARTYLPKALDTRRLKLSLFSQATKILLKQVDGKVVAYGVEYVKDNVTCRAFANKEVIISASAIFTPKLLLLSGIGPYADLRKVGIKTIVNSPNVGKRLAANHVGLGSWEYPNAPLPNGLRVGGLATEYALYGTGPLAHTGAFGYSFACINTSKPCTNPDYMAAYQTGGFNTAAAQSTTISIQCSTHLPKARGSVTLTSADPFAPPNITMNDYGNPEDLNSMIACLRRHRTIMASYPANTIFGKEINPGPTYQTDAQIGAWFKANALAGYHWVSTTKMGNAGDPLAVVDPQLRVRGVGRLRIGDASVLPSTNSHSQATVALVGERVADFILGRA